MRDRTIQVTPKSGLSGRWYQIVTLVVVLGCAATWFAAPTFSDEVKANNDVDLLLQLALKRAPSLLLTSRSKCDQHAAQTENDSGAVLHLLALAHCFQTGVGRPKMLLEAKALFEKAADRGSATAHLALGQFYLDGRIVRKNHLVSASHFRVAADGGLPEAMIEYGLVLWRYGGNLNVACDWFESAANTEAPAGLRLLADCHALGVGGRADADRADTLYRRASRLGDQTAQLKMAGHVFRGVGSDIAKTEGCAWASSAAWRYNQAAAKALAYCLSLAGRN